jgi:hypothetical protein
MNLKFLIVEDEPTFSADCRQYITAVVCERFPAGDDYSLEIVQAECEAKAKSLLEEATRTKQPFDLMILDLTIPILEGGRPRIEHGLNVAAFAQNLSAVKYTVVVSGALDTLSVSQAKEFFDITKTGFEPKGTQWKGLENAIVRSFAAIGGKSSDFFSCFVSYSSKDEALAKRFYFDLQNQGVQCWFAPEDLRTGDPIRKRVGEAILSHDKLLVLLSIDSVRSHWVRDEVETAFERERQENRLILFPVALDDSIMQTDEEWAATIRRERHIGDFRKWKDESAYAKAFDRLLRDLKRESKAEHTVP